MSMKVVRMFSPLAQVDFIEIEAHLISCAAIAAARRYRRRPKGSKERRQEARTLRRLGREAMALRGAQ